MAKTVNYKKFNKAALMPAPAAKVSYNESGFNSLEKTDNMHRLLKYKDMYDHLYDFRKNRRRNIDYSTGKQWNDLIDDPDSPYGKQITEEMYIMRQGKVPLKNNMILPLIKAVMGQFRSNKTEPVAIARDRDEQKVGEMMSIALQYVYQTNDVWDIDAKTLHELMLSGFCVQDVRRAWDRFRQNYEINVSYINPATCFFNADMADPRGKDITAFGILHDMPMSKILSTFAKTKEEAIRIKEIYTYTASDMMSQYNAFSNRRIKNMDFFIPSELNLCRVIEVWSLEYKERLRVHDTLNAESYVVELTEKSNLDFQNKQRIAEATAQGVLEEDVPLIEYEWFVDEYIYYQYLAPGGEALAEGETPFEHGDMPIVARAPMMIDGEVHSFVEDVIDQQRYINRLVTMIDFIMGASAKGVLLFPDDGTLSVADKAEVLEEWVKYNGVIFAKIKAGGTLPQQVSTNATNVGAHELLSIQLKLMNDISGVHGALQGQTATSGTPAAMYAQESQNAATNLVDLYESFNSFRRARDYKLMKTIQQYYDSPRYLNIGGKDYSKESKFYDPNKIRNSEFDISIVESPSTPAFRAGMNDFLMQMFDKQAIDVKQVLETGAFPFADRLLASIQRKEEEMRQLQAGQMQQPGQAQGAPIAIPQELQQQADPRAGQMVDQMLQGSQGTAEVQQVA